MTCDRCHQHPATVCCVDEPDNDGALMFGDQVAGRMLCDECLTVAVADGPWHEVIGLEVAV